MTTATTSIPFTTANTGPPSKTLVDRLVESIFGAAPESSRPEPRALASTTRGGCGRRATSTERWRSSPEVDLATAEPHQARWVYAEWLDLARRRFRDSGALVYSPGTGRAAVLALRGDGSSLEVLAVLGMRWRPGKTVSRRSLRGLQAPGWSRPA